MCVRALINVLVLLLLLVSLCLINKQTINRKKMCFIRVGWCLILIFDLIFVFLQFFVIFPVFIRGSGNF